MGLLSNSTQFVRYNVEGEIPPDFWNFAAERIAGRAFRDIDDTYDEESIGWVAVDNMFDTRFEGASFAVGDHVVLALRIDERKVPTSVLKKFCLKEEERIKKDRQIPKLSRHQKVEIKENVRLSLVKKVFPTATTYDLCWNLSEGSLLFFSTSQKAQELLENFFKDTFDLRLMLQIPFLTAGRFLSPEEQQQLDNLSPEVFI